MQAHRLSAILFDPTRTIVVGNNQDAILRPAAPSDYGWWDTLNEVRDRRKSLDSGFPRQPTWRPG